MGYLDHHAKPGNLDASFASFQTALESAPKDALARAELCRAYRLESKTRHEKRWLSLAVDNCRLAAEQGIRVPAVYLWLAVSSA